MVYRITGSSSTTSSILVFGRTSSNYGMSYEFGFKARSFELSRLDKRMNLPILIVIVERAHIFLPSYAP